jgi:quinol monooxygenase YgiN
MVRARRAAGRCRRYRDGCGGKSRNLPPTPRILALERDGQCRKSKASPASKFHSGKIEEWKRLTSQAMEIVRTKDRGTLQYEIFFNADQTEAIVFERYRDADAALEHFANIAHLMEPLMATATITGEVLGTPNETMRKNLTGDQPKLFTPWMAMQDRLPQS